MVAFDFLSWHEILKQVQDDFILGIVEWHEILK